MARVQVPVNTIARTGTPVGSGATEVSGDATNNHYMANSGVEWLHVRNSGGTSRTVTLVIGVTVDGAAVVNPTVAVPGNTSRIIGPFPEAFYDQLSGDEQGNLQFNVDHADLKLMAFKLP